MLTDFDVEHENMELFTSSNLEKKGGGGRKALAGHFVAGRM